MSFKSTFFSQIYVIFLIRNFSAFFEKGLFHLEATPRAKFFMLIRSQKLVEREVGKVFHRNAFSLPDLEHVCYSALRGFMVWGFF